MDEPVASQLPAPSLSSKAKKILLAVFNFLYDNWFVVGVCVAIGLAAAWPQLGRSHGYIQSQYTVKYGCVIVVFLLSGMGLKTEVLIQALQRPFLHTLVQSLSLGLTPFLGWGVGAVMLKTPLNSSFYAGRDRGLRTDLDIPIFSSTFGPTQYVLVYVSLSASRWSDTNKFPCPSSQFTNSCNACDYAVYGSQTVIGQPNTILVSKDGSPVAGCCPDGVIYYGATAPVVAPAADAPPPSAIASAADAPPPPVTSGACNTKIDQTVYSLLLASM
jgi:hypothetical protein